MKNKYPNLKNPPIKEVVVGISIQLSMEEINSLCQDLIKEYPIKKEIKINSIEGNETGIQSINVAVNGYTLQTEDGFTRVFVERNRVAYSVGNKYISFEELKRNYDKLIKVLQTKLSPSKGIGEIGLRYINKITSVTNIKLFKIQLGCGRNRLHPFFARFEKDNENIKSIITVIENRTPDEIYEIILDIDSHARISTLDDVSATLDKMRKEKNKIFFSSFEDSLIKNWE